MSAFTSVYKREIKSYFATPVAYVFLVIFLFFSGFLTFQEGFFAQRQASMRLFFQNMPLLFLFLVPAIAMRLWAEERRSNSIELLFSLPVTVRQAVLAKFFAAWTVLALALALTFPMVLTVTYLGNPDPGPIVTGYLGSFLLAGVYLAIGSCFSALSRNQVIAFILAVVACGAFLYAGSPSAMNYVAMSVAATWVAVNVIALFGAFLIVTLWMSVRTRSSGNAAGVIPPLLTAAVFIVAFDLFTKVLFPVCGDVLSRHLSTILPEGMELLSFQSRFDSVLRGVLELRDLALFGFLIVGWLWANVMILEERKAA